MTEKLIRQALRKYGKSSDISFFPIETHGTVLGMADILFASAGTGGVAELKILQGVDVIRVPYRPGQRVFLREHARRNPRTYVLGYWHRGSLFFLLGRTGEFPVTYRTKEELDADTIWRGHRVNDELVSLMVDGPHVWAYNEKRRETPERIPEIWRENDRPEDD